MYFDHLSIFFFLVIISSIIDWPILDKFKWSNPHEELRRAVFSNLFWFTARLQSNADILRHPLLAN